MRKPTVHLICNAHLDPVWQWRWEEGCAEALSTFGNAVDILHEHKSFIFNHNEAILYQWVQRYDPALFRSIQKLVKAGRWCISGGWYLQPDLNIPGTESLIRQILVGREFFREHFGIEPVVAYNFDSFGHTGGLPQILRLAGYKMYIHMRPQESDLHLPSDVYRWRGIDGSEILTHRISVGYYHSEYENIEEKLHAGTELALKLNRDVPVFWGIGNHGGGATREALATIDSFAAKERRVKIVHSATEKLYTALRIHAKSAPVVEGDLQRVFTGCYTSFSRVKRRAQRSLAEIVQAEAISAWAWRLQNAPYPVSSLDEVWGDHLFNDFHDILPGSSVEAAELDALDQYGKVSESLRRIRLAAISKTNLGKPRRLYVPVSVWNTNPSCPLVPIELECMIDLRPKWTGDWHMRLFSLDGPEIQCQEEQPESLMPFNWRKKIVWMGHLPQVGFSHYEVRIQEGKKPEHADSPRLTHTLDSGKGLVTSLRDFEGREFLTGPLFQPLVVEDDGDSWGADRWKYRNIVSSFEPRPEKYAVVEAGPVRTIIESGFSYNQSRITLRTISYCSWPVIEYRFRIYWAEQTKRLKLSVPTVFKNARIYCEVPGGAIFRPADGEEHVHGRWCLLEGDIDGKKVGFAVINSGQHGLDYLDGEIRLSVLRSAAYCHDPGFKLTEPPARKYMDQGVHEFRLLVTTGDASAVRDSLPGLADWLSAPPIVYSHLPIGNRVSPINEFMTLQPQNVRLLATCRSRDGKAMIVRLQEATGVATKARLAWGEHKSELSFSFKPFEIKTLRLEKSGKCREVALIRES